MLQSKNITNHGFSLIELMIAVAIIAVLSLAIIQVLLSSLVLDKGTREYSIALNAAKAQMEQYQLLSFNSDLKTAVIAGAGTSVGNFYVPQLRVSPKDSFGDKTLAGFISLTSKAANNNLIDIQIVVEWRGQDGKDHTIQVWGKRSDRGANWTK